MNNDQLFNNNSQASTSTSSTRIGIGRPLPPSPMTQRERDDIAIAMELSLRETNSPNVPPLHVIIKLFKSNETKIQFILLLLYIVPAVEAEN